MTDTLIENALKAWRFLYRRGFIEGFGHLSVRPPGSGARTASSAATRPGSSARSTR